MDKQSIYNVSVPYSSRIIVYNTLSNALILLNPDEYDKIQKLLCNLPEFEISHPKLYNSFKQNGFLVPESKDEVSMVVFRNRLAVYNSHRVHLTINPTLDCNLKCWYCSTEYANAKHCGGMNDITVDSITKHIEKLIFEDKISEFHLDWFGGEPLLYFKEVIIPIASFAKQICENNGVKFSHHITTNATLITTEMLIQMNNLGLNSFQIPLDGNKKHHDSIKYSEDGTGTFDTIINAINLIPVHIDSPNIILRINYDKKTLYGIEQAIDLINSQAKSCISVDFQKVWQVECDDALRDKLKEIKLLFNRNGLKSGYWAYQTFSCTRCYADKLYHYAINYDGKVFKCTAQDYGDDKVIGVLNEDGNITWNAEYLSKLFSKPSFENNRCMNCKALPVCMGPCIIRSYEAKTQGLDIPCVFENAQYSFDSFIVEEAFNRGLIKEDEL